MTKTLSFFLSLFIFTTSLFSVEKKEFSVSYNANAEPFSYNIDNEHYGLSIYIFKAWAKYNNYNIKFIPTKSSKEAISLLDNNVDFSLEMDSSNEYIEKSIIFYKTKTSLFTLKLSNDKFKTIGIIGKKYKSHINEEFNDINMKSYQTHNDLISALIKKEVDAIYDDSVILSTLTIQHNKNHLIKKNDRLSVFSDIYVSSKSKENIDIFNKGFHKIPQGILKEIETDWIINEENKFFKKDVLNFLTIEEKKWLSNNPIARVAVMNYWPHKKDGSSLHTEILKLINKYAGTNIVPVKFDAWKFGFDKATKGEYLHGIMGLSWSEEREKKHFFYSPAYNFTPCYLITRNDDDSIKNLSDLKNKTVYLKNKSITHKMMSQEMPDANIIDVADVKTMYKKLATSTEADAMISYFVDESKVRKNNLKVVKLIYDRFGEVAIGINHKYPELNSIVNKAFKIIPKAELSRLRDKMDLSNKDNLKLTKEEKAWLDKRIPVNYVYDPDWAPFEWKNGLEKQAGIVSDLLNIVKERSGIELISSASQTWKEAVKKAKSGEVDMYSAVGITEERLVYMNFTKGNLLSAPYVFVTRQKEDYTDGFDSLKNKKIAVNKNSTIHGILRENKQNVKLTLLEKTEENGFIKLRNGDIDVFIVNSAKAKYYINSLGFDDLKIGYKTEFNLDLKIAINKRMPKEVISILDKAMDTITEKELNDIFHKWTQVKITNKTDWILITKIAGLILLVILFLLYNTRKLNQMVKEKTKDIESKKDEIEELNKGLELKVKERTADLVKTKKDILQLLNNAGQGFLYFNRDMIIGNEVSKEALRIFDQNIVTKNIMELLYPADKEKQEFNKGTMLDILDGDEMMSEVMLSLLQKEFTINNQFIEIEYKVLDEDTFMLILTDITASKELDQKIKDEQQVLKMVVETVTSIEQFTEVKNDYEEMISKIDKLKVLENLSSLRMEIHTYKGLFAQKSMLHIVKKLHDFETIIDDSLKNNSTNENISNITTDIMQSWLDEDISILKNILGDDYFNNSNNISINKNRIIEIENAIKSSSYFEECSDILLDISSLKYHNIDTFMNPYKQLVDQLAIKLEKPVNPLIINKNKEIYISDEYKPFLNSIVHIFRNNVDHGIETVEKREELGKELFGTIECNIEQTKDKLNIDISDDGQGINVDIIKELAIKRGIYTKDEVDKLSEQDVLLIVFKDEFTTNDTVTDISGRGVGLASILYELNCLNGSIQINNNFGNGIKFSFTLPLKK